MNTPSRTPRLGWLAAFCYAVLHTVPAAAAAPKDLASTLHWDLTYRTALRDHPIPSNEFVALWTAELPDSRPIQKTLAAYAGAPVEAAVLIETPDNRKGDSEATWFVKTKNTAQVCMIEPDEDKRCESLDPARTEAFVRTVMNLRMPALDPAQEPRGPDTPSSTVLLGYRALLSVWIDGRVLQRPVAAREFADIAREWGETDQPGASRNVAIVDRLLDKGARPDGAPGAEVVETPLGIAVGIPDQVIAQHLIKHGANPNALLANAPQSRAPLATAALNQDLPMMDLLIGAGAHPDWTDSSERTALMLVLEQAGQMQRAFRRAPPMTPAATATLERIVRRLVAAGADVNYTNGACQGALSTATEYGLDAAVTLLKSLGADPQRAASCAAGQGAPRR